MTTMTRRQLYDLIWSKPMREAAAEVGISDVGLKKVCIRHRVPVPLQGYWNKIHAGQSPRKALFRDIDDAALDRVAIAGAYYRVPQEVRQTLVAAQARDKASDGKVIVEASARPSVPSAVQLATALKNARPDANGLVRAADPNLIQVAVAPESVDRTVAIVDALLRAAAERGIVTAPGVSSDIRNCPPGDS